MSFFDPHVQQMSNGQHPWSFEAYVVKYADEIAQRHHDIEDGLIAKLIGPEEAFDIIRGVASKPSGFTKLKRLSLDSFIPEVSRSLVGMLVDDLIDHSKSSMRKFCVSYGIKSAADFAIIYPQIDPGTALSLIGFSANTHPWHKDLEDFLRDRILNSYQVQTMDGRATYVIRRLFQAYITNPQQLPDKTVYRVYQNYNPGMIRSFHKSDLNPRVFGLIRNELQKQRSSPDALFQTALARTVCDYVSGMTDNYAMSEYRRLYGVSD